jgi:prepilin peptidase CpaA
MLLLPAGLALCLASLHDIAARTIPNALSLAIAALGLAAHLLAGDAPPALLAALGVLLLGILAWRCGVMGGGDVKLLAACTLLAGPATAPDLLLAVALAGGVLALVYLGLRPLLAPPAARRPASLLARALRAEAWRIRRGGPLPYAVAIGLGTFFTLLG